MVKESINQIKVDKNEIFCLHKKLSSGEKLTLSTICSTVKQGVGSVMLRECFSSAGTKSGIVHINTHVCVGMAQSKGKIKSNREFASRIKTSLQICPI